MDARLKGRNGAMPHRVKGDWDRSARRLLICLVTAVLVGCGSASPGVTPSASLLASEVFYPAFTYTLPDGWTVSHDLGPIFRFLPTGFTNDDFDSGGTDGITLISSVTVSKIECDETDPSIGVDADSIAAALLSRPGLVATKLDTSVGGLPGVVLEIRLDPKWTHPGCGGGAPGVALIHSPSYDQGIGGKTLIQIYLAPIPGSTSHAAVAIEVDDLTGGSHIDSLSKIVSGIRFVR
jgi:hypothetical protein